MMNIISFVHEGLGNSSYLVQVADNEALLVDPDRSTERYLDAARSAGWKIASVFETHLHADFVSGGREIANATGADILLPASAQAEFPHKPLTGGQRLRIGGVEVEPIESPSHTPEHMSYALRVDGQPSALFSGGALIVGSAARTDLLSPQMTEPLTRDLFRTLKNAFSSLADDTSLYPTHGAGSFCSAAAGSKRTSTLGEERAHNPVFRIHDEDAFVSWFPTTFPSGTPAYFTWMRPINQTGARLRSEITFPPRLSPDDFDAARSQALVIDLRPSSEYAEAHIPGAVNIAFREAYSTWLGWLIKRETSILFVLGNAPIEEIVDESLVVGYEHFAGWLDGGMEAWMDSGGPVEQTRLVDADLARKALLDGAAALDVREPEEFVAGHIEGAINLPLGSLEQNLDRIPKDRPVVTICGVGDRSSTAASMLERAGTKQILNLSGGIEAWKEAGHGTI